MTAESRVPQRSLAKQRAVKALDFGGEQNGEIWLRQLSAASADGP
jgi:hypothetical protein